MSIINFPVLYIPDPNKGKPLFYGQIYVGEPDLDPEVEANQKQLNVVQEDGTVVPVLQPFLLSTGGVPVYNGDTVRLDVDGNYSIKILNKLGAQTYYIENVFEGQPITAEDGGMYFVRNFEDISSAATSTKVKEGDAANIKEDGMWDYVLASSVTPDEEYTVTCTGVPTLALVKRNITIPEGRDIKSLTAPAFNISSLPNSVMIEKLRDATYEEFAVYTPLTSNGIDWQRWLFTNRFNVTNDGAPRMIMNTLASLNTSTQVARTPANNVSETTGSPTTVTKVSADAVQVGTWSVPATVLTTTDVSWSSTIGDTCTYTITGVERLHLRGLYAGNGGIGKITITESAVEIPEANYLLPSDHLINFISTATGNTTMHLPLANGLDSAKTYVVEIEVDVTNTDPTNNRVYQAGLLGYDDIAYNATGIHGIVLDASLGGETNSMSVTPGTTAVYEFTNTTKIDWRYIQTPVGAITQFKVFDSVGDEISTYENQNVDQYAVGSTAKKISVAKDLDKGTYYLHVINGKTKNASATDYRYYDTGSIGYDQTTAGVIGVDDFDNYDVPDNVQDPNNDSDQGTKYMLIGTGNLELAIDVRRTVDALGVEEFVGGIHGYETTPTPVYTLDDVVIDYAGGVAGDTWLGSDLKIEFTTTLKFPADLSNFCTADYKFNLSQSGYSVETTKTALSESIIHDDFSIMLNCPNTDSSVHDTQGLNVGGGFKHVAADKNYIIDQFDNSGTFIEPLQDSVIFVNREYAAFCSYVTPATLGSGMDITPFATTRDYSLIQDRTDRTVKFYTRAFNGDDANGVTVPSGTSWSHTKTYRAVKGNFKGLLGII